jgi:ferritin-like metal-binding protein YciE
MSTSSSSLGHLFENELKDVYDAEQRIDEALGEMADEVANDDIAQAFRDHQQETRGQIERLEQVFDMIDASPGDEECEATQGIITEHDEFLNSNPDQSEIDVFDVTAGQKTEHYEIATYGNLAKLADELGMDEAGDLLHENLEEEEAFLDRLVELAESYDYDQLQAS